MIGLPEAVAVLPPGEEVAVYWVIGLPPLDDGAVNVTVACVFPDVAVPIVGAPGTVAAAGVTLLDSNEAAPVPTALVAVELLPHRWQSAQYGSPQWNFTR